MAEQKKLYFCRTCHQTMNADNFYKSNNMEKYGSNDGYLHECKKCSTRHVDNWRPETFLPLLEELDVPWVPNLWNSTLAKYGQGRVSGTTILGRYLSKMKIIQYRDKRWADTEFLQKQEELKIRDTMKRQGFTAAEIDQAIAEGKMPMPAKPVSEDDMDTTEAFVMPQRREKVDLGLTDEDKLYLKVKWGDTYQESEWVQLERLYVDMMNSYDIQAAGHRDTLKHICKASLKAHQLIDIGDVDGYQKMTKVYDGLMKSGNFTASQNKTDQGEYIDSISELVALCESDGFIPRYYVEEPKDKVDRVLQDLQGYTRSLIMEETNLGNMIDTALQQIQSEAARADKISLEDGEDDDEIDLDGLLFNEDTIEDEDDELTDDDLADFNNWLQEDEDDGA